MVTADAAFLARWDSARNRSFQRVLGKNRVQKTRELTVHVRVNGLDPNISITLNLLMQVKGVVCGVARPFSEGSIDQASRHLGIPFLGNAKQPEKQALVSRYVETTLCPGVPRCPPPLPDRDGPRGSTAAFFFCPPFPPCAAGIYLNKVLSCELWYSGTLELIRRWLLQQAVNRPG